MPPLGTELRHDGGSNTSTAVRPSGLGFWRLTFEDAEALISGMPRLSRNLLFTRRALLALAPATQRAHPKEGNAEEREGGRLWNG